MEEAPELPATKLAEECYGEMFGYSGQKKAPYLPDTELVTYCYNCLFEYRESLEEGPNLHAKQLYPGCYEGLFENCRNLKPLVTKTPARLIECEMVMLLSDSSAYLRKEGDFNKRLLVAFILIISRPG